MSLEMTESGHCLEDLIHEKEATQDESPLNIL